MKNISQVINFTPKMCHIKQIHFVGIGGSGMSSIAKILIKEGYKISGSDLMPNEATQQLKKLGAKIFFKHCSENITTANVVVISSAINFNNPEIIAAKKARIPVIKRAEMLAELMRFRYGIAVTGTHGKTTTTSMLANIYSVAGLNPTVINGGTVKSIGIHSQLGCGYYLIAEADESDGSFLYLHPIVIVITNIDIDHINNYQGSFEKLKQAFISFLRNLPFYGRAVLCIDDPVICNLLPQINRKITTYGFSKKADIRIVDYYQKKTCGYFFIHRYNYKNKLQLKVNNAPGRHNALNAAAAVAVATEAGINDKNILQAMFEFQGIEHRFDYLGCYNLTGINGKFGKIILISDYGHHPTEINVTIKTVRSGWPKNRLIMVFQPHRYTRIRDLYNKFVNVLSTVDILLILNVYSAGESPIIGADSQSLCYTLNKYKLIKPIWVLDDKKLLTILLSILQNNDLILMQGAGTINKIARKLADNQFQL